MSISKNLFIDEKAKEELDEKEKEQKGAKDYYDWSILNPQKSNSLISAEPMSNKISNDIGNTSIGSKAGYMTTYGDATIIHTTRTNMDAAANKMQGGFNNVNIKTDRYRNILYEQIDETKKVSRMIPEEYTNAMEAMDKMGKVVNPDSFPQNNINPIWIDPYEMPTSKKSPSRRILKKELPINKEEELIINIEELADELANEVLIDKKNIVEYSQLLEKYKKLILKHERQKKE